MPFESINSDATQEQASEWSMRMMAQGYRAAGRIERAIRVVRDCRNIKDPLKIANRILIAYHDLVFAVNDARGHPDPTYRDATRSALAGFQPQLVNQFPRCLAAYTNARKSLLEKAKGGKRQFAIASKSSDAIRSLADSETWRDIPPECQTACATALAYWRDQAALLEKYT